jgi:hypothetical protein
MFKRHVRSWLAIAAGSLFAAQAPSDAQAPKASEGQTALTFRVERYDDNRWKPEKIDRTFKDDTIRFRFLANVAGTLYVLNTGQEIGSPEPIYAGEGAGLRRHLGLGTHIGANQIGFYPDPTKGGGLRFTRSENRRERFLFAFVPDDLSRTRALAAIAVGAEGWDFEEDETQTVLARPGNILFHYFELKSR